MKSVNVDRAIAMLEMSTDNIIQVDEQTFNQLVLDEWSWNNTSSPQILSTGLCKIIYISC